MFSLAKEQVFQGQAKRVAQGSGPFNLKCFKHFIRFKEKGNNGVPTIRTYFQIDGEFYQLINPKSI